DHLFLHEGVIPNTQISLALQLEHHWDEGQLCWRPETDEWGCTSLPNIVIAGDGAGIAGAEAGILSGRLAALDAAAKLGRIEGSRSRKSALIARARPTSRSRWAPLQAGKPPDSAQALDAEPERHPKDQQETAPGRCYFDPLAVTRMAGRRGGSPKESQ